VLLPVVRPEALVPLEALVTAAPAERVAPAAQVLPRAPVLALRAPVRQGRVPISPVVRPASRAEPAVLAVLVLPAPRNPVRQRRPQL
jgi:hypothetical protein